MSATRHLTTIALLGLLLSLSSQTACQKRPSIDRSNPEIARFIELMMPQQIELQQRLTRPVDFDGDGDAEGLEVILSAKDYFEDPVKVVGTFVIELYELRYASGDRTGTRIAFWRVDIKSNESMVMYWDRLSRFYRLPLTLQTGHLPRGRYVVEVTLNTPDEQRLSDSYEFEFDGIDEP